MSLTQTPSSGSLSEKDRNDDSHADCDSFPVSFAQQRLWMLDQLAPGNPAYNIRVGIKLKGDLSVSSLRKALDEIVNRHESLRTNFAYIGELRQIIAPPDVSAVLSITDLSNAPVADRERLIQHLALQEAQQPFDLSQRPLFRATLLRVDEHEHVLLLTMHHIISDGWSMGVLFKELSTLYNAFAKETPSPLPEPVFQYADYVVWQRQAATAELLASDLSYWQQQLAGAPQVLALPTDHARPAQQSHRGRRLPVHLPADLVQRLKALGVREGATLFMTLLAAF